MRKTHYSLLFLLSVLCFSFSVFSQSVTISGTVHNSTNKDVVPAVSVAIKGTSIGTFTDEKGNFKLSTTQRPPLVLVFTSIGFEAKEVSVSNATTPVMVDFVPASTLGREVVVSASR